MKESISMQVIHDHAAGIDVGSRSHYVAVGQDPEDVSEFGVYSRDHHQMIEWLNERSVTTIAMESTGNYWQTLFSALQGAGFEVLLVNGNQIKNVKGKTDVKDCQWIQRLHSLGLLRGSFLPSEDIEKLRNYQRHRNWLVEQCSKMSNKMQKALRLMNMRLDVALNDIMGKSGQRIIESIIAGERDGERLADLIDGRVKKSKQEVAAALSGQWKDELLFELSDCYEFYLLYQRKMDHTDEKIALLLKEMVVVQQEYPHDLPRVKKKHKKNQPQYDLSSLSCDYLGVDLFAIDGVSHTTVSGFISEVGLDIYKFATAKRFVSWLRLAPSNKISGGKILSSRTPKGKHPLAIMLRNAANSVGLRKSGVLKSFFNRIAYKKGRAAAITATARKLAVIIWNMVVKKQAFAPVEEVIYTQKIKTNAIAGIKKKMQKLNLSLTDLAPIKIC